MLTRNLSSFTILIICAVTLSMLPGVASPVSAQRKTTARRTQYSCPMHPEVTSTKGGECSKCGMNLRATSPAATQPSEPKTTVEKTAESVTGLRIPDPTVIDQNGRQFKFYTDLVKGRTVAINFIFTTCTTICPPLTATFRKVQQQLGERAGRDVELISISVDPTTDVPERLKSFSEKFKAGPGWTFVTGSKPEIDQLLRALGASAPDKNDHTPMILVGNDASGYWTRTYGLAPAATIVKTIDEASAQKNASGASVKQSAASQSQASGATEAQQSGAAQKKPPAETPAQYFPNHILLTQDNKPVRFYDDLLKGKVALINFVFTTCTGVCPPMTANLAKVQKQLGEHVGREVVMLTISVDPTTDTPAALKKYADTYKAQPGWYFLTGKKENVDWVLYKLGGYVEDKMQHTSILIIGKEATGQWVKTYAMRNPAEIAAAVKELIDSKQ